MNKTIKNFAAVLLITSALVGLTGCGSNDAVNTSSQVKKVNVVLNSNYWPLAYENDEGKPDGYAVEVNKLIDSALPQYEFNYETSTGEAILLGLESGKYDMAIGGFYWNKEREKKFLFPKNNSGGGIVGVMVKKELGDKIKNLSDVADNNLKIVPTLASGGIIGILKDYNEKNADKQIKFDLTDVDNMSQDLQWVLDGRYDVLVGNKHQLKEIIDKQKNTAVKDGIAFSSFTVVKSYDLFNKNQAEIQKAYDEQLKKLKDSGKLSELSIKYFGEDLFKLDQE